MTFSFPGLSSSSHSSPSSSLLPPRIIARYQKAAGTWAQIDGKPIINLPPKFEHIDHVVFSKDEEEFYQALKDKTQLQFNKYRKAGTVGKNYSNILVLLLRLRQCCCHPHLIIDLEEAAAGSAELTEEQMIDRAMALEPDVVSRLLAADGGFEVS